jgi:ADP-heptose:LPS heptosyltransferase
MRVLIVRTDRLGDLLLTIPMAQVLKKHDPTVHISFLVESYTAPILSLAKDVNDVHVFDKNWTLARKIQAFRDTEADVAFFPSPKHELAIAASFARIPKRVGTAFRWYSPLFTDPIYEHRKTAERHEAEYNVRMLQKIGAYEAETPLPYLELPAAITPQVEILLNEAFGELRGRYVVLHVGSGGSTPHWPTAYFANFAEWISKKFGFPILLTGTSRDQDRISEFLLATEGRDVNAKVLLDASMLELAAVLQRAELFVSVGTGPGHLAASLGTRTIGLFPLSTAISKERWGFRGLRALNLSPERPPSVSCPSCKDCTCLEHVHTEAVIAAAEKLLSM